MSLRSPKNRFSGEIHFANARPGLGSVVSFTSNDIDELMNELAKYRPGVVIIKENYCQYPEFDWHVIAQYSIA